MQMAHKNQVQMMKNRKRLLISEEGLYVDLMEVAHVMVRTTNEGAEGYLTGWPLSWFHSAVNKFST